MKQIREYHLGEEDSRGTLKVFETHAYLNEHGIKVFKPHRHSFYQLIWFTGKGRHYIDYNTFGHPANALFFIDKGQVHYFCDRSDNVGYLFHFNDQFLHRYAFSDENWAHYRLFHELTSPFLELSGEMLSKVELIRRLLSTELAHREFNFEKQSYFLFRLLLLNIERLKRVQGENLLRSKGDFSDVAKFHELAERHLAETRSIDFYAGELGMSAKKLTYLTSAYLGNTPANIINEKKATEAKRLLSNSNLSIKEISYKLGFKQATYFTKFFKKFTNYGPKEFRKLIEEGAFTEP